MHIIETDRIDIRARFDCMTKKTSGDVYSKIEGEKEVHVGIAKEEPDGTGMLYIIPEYQNKDYIQEDFKKLKNEFEDYAGMWRSRASRGIY